MLLVGGGVALALLLVVVAAGVVLYANTDTLRGVTERRLSAAFGREVTISGDFGLTVSLSPTMRAAGFSVANATWGSRAEMLRADTVEVAFAVVPLLFGGDIRIDRLVVSGAEVLVETGPEGALNWKFGSRDATSEVADEPRREMTVGAITLRDSVVLWRGRGKEFDETVRIDRLEWTTEGADGAVSLEAAGSHDDQEFSAEARLGSLDALIARSESFPIRLGLSYGAARLDAAGRIGAPLFPGATQLAVELSGEGDALLERLARRELPDPGEWRVAGELVSTAEGLRAAKLDARLGHEDRVEALVQDGVVDWSPAGIESSLPVVVRGRSLAALGEVIGAGLPAVGPFQLAAELSGSGDSFSLTGLSGTIGPDSAPLLSVTEGRIESLGPKGAVDVRLRAVGDSLASLGGKVGVKLPELGPYQATAHLVGALSSPQLRGLDAVIGSSDQVRLRVTKGMVEDLLGKARLDLPVHIDGAKLSALSSLLDRRLPPAAFSFRGRVTGPVAAPSVTALQGEITDRGTRISVTGKIGNLRPLGRVDIGLSARAPSVAALSWLVDGKLPASPPVRLTTRAVGTPAALTLNGISLTIGETTMRGRLEVRNPPKEVPQLRGKVSFDRLDMGVLGGDKAGESGQVRIPVLDELEGEVAVSIDRLELKNRTFRNASADLALRDGNLTIRDLKARIGGGTVRGAARLDKRNGGMAEVSLRLTAENVALSGLLAGKGAGQVRGLLNVDLNVDGTGRTVDQLLDDLEGDATAFVEEGTLEKVPLNRLVPDLDILRILPFFRNTGTAVRVNCMVAEFDIESGVAKTEAMLDTGRMTLLGSGAVDLESTSLDFSVRPVAKSRKLSATAVPVDVTGDLSNPDVRPRMGEAVGSAVRGFLGGLLVPLNQISGWFGSEAKSACGDALARARDRRRGAARSR